MDNFVAIFHPKFSKECNHVYSPLSIYIAMSMLRRGTTGKVRKELDKLFTMRQTQLKEIVSNKKILSAANAIYINKEFCDAKLSESYQQTIAELYEGIIKKLAFDYDAVKIINNFVEKQTNGCIKDLIKTIDSSGMFVILNTIYFKGLWRNPFKKSNTEREKFDKIYEVDMMKRYSSKEFYGEHRWCGLRFESCCLLYEGKGFGMMFAKSDNLDKLERILLNKVNFIQAVKREQRKTKLSVVAIPKFKIRTRENLVESFKVMGVKSLFETSFDYKKLFVEYSTIPPTFVNMILHEAFVEVDEKGTTAAATTAVMLSRGYNMNVKEFYLDKPFIGIIYFKNLPLFIIKFIKPESLKRHRDAKNQKNKKVKYI